MDFYIFRQRNKVYLSTNLVSHEVSNKANAAIASRFFFIDLIRNCFYEIINIHLSIS